VNNPVCDLTAIAECDSSAALATVVEHCPLALIAWDLGGRALIWNRAAERLFGWSAHEIAGRPIPFPDSAGAEIEEGFIARRVTRAGAVVEVELSRAPLLGMQGVRIGTLEFVRDVSEERFLRRALIDATERESRRLGRALHDELCQHLLGAAFSAKALAGELPADSPAAESAEEVARLLSSGVRQARDLVRALNPVELDASALMSALRDLSRTPREGTTCQFACDPPVLLRDPEAALQTFRIAQEAVSNALHHSGAKRIVVRLSQDGGTVRLSISDDGAGFDRAADNAAGIGLKLMEYRARALGGELRIDTPSEGGTCVTLAFPKR